MLIRTPKITPKEVFFIIIFLQDTDIHVEMTVLAFFFFLTQEDAIACKRSLHRNTECFAVHKMQALTAPAVERCPWYPCIYHFL